MAKRIVVVEDTPEILMLFHDVLTDEGYEVDAFASPQMALAQIAQIGPDLLIVDQRLPGNMTGVELVQALREQPATAAIPVLLCTAMPFAWNRARYGAPGGLVILPKPFDLDTLLALVTQLVGRARDRRRARRGP